jgi:hypothetical protein
MVLVYCDTTGPRHRYILDIIFKDMLGVDYGFTADPLQFQAWHGPKMNYSSLELPGDIFHIRPEGLLAETGLRNELPRVTAGDGFPVFFMTAAPSGLPYDPLAMAFFLVTRYEEYLPFEADQHGRFPAGASMAFRHGFLDKPMVNMLAKVIREGLSTYNPHYPWPKPAFRFRPTFDVDIAFAHLGKGWIRGSAAMARLLLKLDRKGLSGRIKVIRGRSPDPYDNFDFIQRTVESAGMRPAYFFLVGDFGRYDRNSHHLHPRLRSLVHGLSPRADIGIHPSYRSFGNVSRLSMETARLSRLTGNSIVHARQHFLRLAFPSTYRAYIDLGITDDHSLGYSDTNGFRAGTANPFPFFDLLRNRVTPLLLHPFIFMDSAFVEQMRTPPERALEEMNVLMDRAAEHGGEAAGIWHNYALADDHATAPWREVFSRAIEHASSLYVRSL